MLSYGASAFAGPLRFVYQGNVYHIMARGDGGKAIFIIKEAGGEIIGSHKVALASLSKAHTSACKEWLDKGIAFSSPHLRGAGFLSGPSVADRPVISGGLAA